MSKGKLAKFADMETYENVFQYPYSVVSNVSFAMRGQWREQYFNNQNPIVLELGCGKGEYTVGLAKLFPQVNFIGVDIKGARMWTGATQALKEGLTNVAFLRTNIEIIDHFFAPDEVQEIWLTFCDPQMKNPRKRLTSTFFMQRYRRFLVNGGIIHLKTDSNFLFTYTCYMVERNHLPVEARTEDLYGDSHLAPRTSNHSDLLRVDVAGTRPEHQIHEIPAAPRRPAGRARHRDRTRRLPQLPPLKTQFARDGEVIENCEL